MTVIFVAILASNTAMAIYTVPINVVLQKPQRLPKDILLRLPGITQVYTRLAQQGGHAG
jgi:hypothetical protein